MKLVKPAVRGQQQTPSRLDCSLTKSEGGLQLLYNSTTIAAENATDWRLLDYTTFVVSILSTVSVELLRRSMLAFTTAG